MKISDITIIEAKTILLLLNKVNFSDPEDAKKICGWIDKKKPFSAYAAKEFEAAVRDAAAGKGLPDKCIFCGEPLKEGDNILCPTCVKVMKYIASGRYEADKKAKAEAKRLEAERLEAERLEAERKAEEERLAREEEERLEAERKAEEERLEAERKAEEERLAREEAERLEAERKAEEERLAREEEERLEAERLEAERKAEEERLEAERKAEEERLAREEEERLEAERIEAERKAEEERLEAERKAEEERLAREEEERLETERLEAERKAEEERLEAERKAEEERLAKEEEEKQKKGPHLISFHDFRTKEDFESEAKPKVKKVIIAIATVLLLAAIAVLVWLNYFNNEPKKDADAPVEIVNLLGLSIKDVEDIIGAPVSRTSENDTYYADYGLSVHTNEDNVVESISCDNTATAPKAHLLGVYCHDMRKSAYDKLSALGIVVPRPESSSWVIDYQSGDTNYEFTILLADDHIIMTECKLIEQ